MVLRWSAYLVCASMCGCHENPKTAEESRRVEKLEQQIDALRSKVDELAEDRRRSPLWEATWKANLDEKGAKWKLDLESRISDIAYKQYLLEFKNMEIREDISRELREANSTSSSAPIGIDQKGFSPVKTKLGLLFLSVRDVQPHLDGFRLKMEIGNPQSVVFAGAELVISFPAMRPMPSMVAEAPVEMVPDSDKWERLSIRLTERFAPARWTPITVTVPKITLDQLRNARCAIVPNEIQLAR